jgi:hypothetical protein
VDRFEWNGLRTGAPVVVHTNPDLHLVEGHVFSVGRSRRRTAIGVRMADGTARWPTSGEVHALPRRDDTVPCWRCSSRPTDRPSPLGAPASTPNP